MNSLLVEMLNQIFYAQRIIFLVRRVIDNLSVTLRVFISLKYLTLKKLELNQL